jgi:hypothetical protein
MKARPLNDWSDTMFQFVWLVLAVGLLSCGREANQTSETKDIADVQSMWQRADGQFDVLCRDNSRELASASMIQKGLVCNGAAQISETFEARGGSALDLLVVIDNSSSMEEYQARMSNTLGSVISGFQDSDWQIAVVTTDSSCLRGGRPITKSEYIASVSEVESRFRTAITPGGGGAVVERGIYFATEGLKGHCGNPNNKWTRAGAQQAALVITDEPNCGGSINEGCPGQPGEKADYFVQNTAAGTKFFGLLFDQENPQCPYLDMPLPQEYWSLVDKTGGMWGDICASNYDSFLMRMSNELRGTGSGSQSVTLSHDPVPGQLIVKLNGTELPASEYELTGRVIRLLKAVQGSAQVTVVYKRG